MALEGFFTLIELEEGILSLQRVEELVTALQKEKDSALQNLVEAARQLSAVANTLAATKNLDILKHFIHSGGLTVLDQWLKEVQHCGEESSVDECTCELLRALEKLPIDRETTVFSETMVSIKTLVEHKSSSVQERAKALIDRFSQGGEECDLQDEQAYPSKAMETVTDADEHATVLPRSDMQHESSTDCSKSDSIAAVETHTLNSSSELDGKYLQKDAHELDTVVKVMSNASSSPEHVSSADVHAEPSVVEPASVDAVDVKELKECEGSAVTGEISKLTMRTSNLTKSRMDSELDFVEDDAIGIARQVGIEAEREVVDFGEPLCSSSKKSSERVMQQPESPYSVNGDQQPMVEVDNDMPAEQNFTGCVVSSKGEDHSADLKIVENAGEGMCKQKVSQASEVAEESASGKHHGFDLNELSYSLEMDQPTVKVSSSVTAASPNVAEITATSPKVAEVKLCGIRAEDFEGKLRCGVSAATSSFYPPSGRRTPDVEKAFSVEGSSSSKQRTGLLDIDLNVADNDGVVDAILPKTPVSAGLPSGESSVEVSSKRAKRLQWDLNHTVGTWDRSPSPVSWPSLKQPVARNLDLNDNPAVSGAHGPLSDRRVSFSDGRNSSGGTPVDVPCISIMGAKVPIPINHREVTTPRTMCLLPNGPVLGSSTGGNYAPSGSVGLQYAMNYVPPSSGFGYNGFRMEPFTSLSPGMYGSGAVPYTVDPREVTMQMMGSPMTAPGPRLPFPMSMTSTPSSYNWIGASQPNLDPRSSFYMGEVDNREQRIPRQVLIPGQASNMMEQQQQQQQQQRQMGSASQAMSSGIGVKRREPDNGCDPHLGLFRMQPPPWQ